MQFVREEVGVQTSRAEGQSLPSSHTGAASAQKQVMKCFPEQDGCLGHKYLQREACFRSPLGAGVLPSMDPRQAHARLCA